MSVQLCNESNYKTIHENIKKKLNIFIEKETIPHIVFHGPSGSGKRTILNYLIDNIYKESEKKREFVMYINCAHGKGIRFIRDDLKFFAKTNINNKGGKIFKSIVLFNADKLTIDAQSALRRCIEKFSHTTRFFIIIEDQNKLLKPILSRFCNIYIPKIEIDNNEISLHTIKNNILLEENKVFYQKREKWLKQNLEKKTNLASIEKIFTFSEKLYEKGYCALDIINYIKNKKCKNEEKKFMLLVYFDKIRKEFRNEKKLMYLILFFYFMRENIPLENISEM